MSRGIPSQPGFSRAGSSPSRWEPPGVEELQAMLPQYEIVAMLGRGGMGAVYQARQTSLDRPVAIKILSAELEENDSGFADRFKNEARAMGKLNHPGIVTVYDFGETADGMLYIVMEYVEGTDVARMISSQKRLHSAHAMAITAHVCDALGYAHERGIIHRDIKPANIMVGYDGAVKVADFGLAKLSADGQTMGLTQSGMAMGTMHYMAPETLMMGIGSVDLRADIYAVGVMLYQMLTGNLPQGMFELPSMQVAGLDPRYDGIIAKALRQDREIRYQSAGEMRADLDGLLTQPVVKVEADADTAPAALPTQARPQRPGGQPVRPMLRVAPPKKKSRIGMILAGLGVLAALALGAFFVFKPKAAPISVPSGTPVLQAATKDQPFINSLGMKFVPVPILGGPTAGQRVLFSVWDTRVQDYEVFAKETSHDWRKPDFEQGPTHPALNVNWEDAQAFCQWLTARERKAGKLASNEVYRLPSDYEWSCAVGIGEREDAAKLPAEKRGKINDVFPWGAQWPPPAGAGNYAGEEMRPALAAGKYTSVVKDVLAGYNDGFVETSPVGSFAANRFGLYDMGGNVWQWCEDWFDTDQKGRVLRGASWRDYDRGVLSSGRIGDTPGNRHINIGFRCVVASAVSNSPAAATPIPAVITAPAMKAQPFVNALGQTAGMEGAAITITSSDPINILKLEIGQPRLYDSNPLRVIEKIAPELTGWQFTSIPQRRRNSFQISVTKAGVIYAFGEYGGNHPTREQFLGEDASRWEPADGAIEGRIMGACYKRKVTPGESITLQAFELELAAGSIAIAGNHAVAPPVTSLPGASLIGATKEQPFVNSLGMEFVPVPILGGPTGGQRVLFGVWDTRVQDYEVFVKETRREWPKVDFAQGPAHPAVMMTWEDAQLFCQWLTGREQAAGRLPAEWRYRLPSDHEWSCAVGIGGREDAAKLPAEKHQQIKNTFPWGSAWPPPKGAGNYAGEEMLPVLATGSYNNYLRSVIAGYDDGYVNTSPVGSFAANPFGLFDIVGNVQQWCEDWFDKEQKDRVLRGAAWNVNNGPGGLSSSCRPHYPPGGRTSNHGFRCVLAPASAPSAPAQSAPATSATSKAGTEMEKWLAQVDGPQEEAFQKQVFKPFETGVADLRARYLAALDADMAKASAAGQLADALALRAERQAFEKAQNVAADDAGTPSSVKALRASFRQQLTKLDQDRTIKAKALHAPYDAILAKNETLLTQSQHLDEALLLKNKRDEIARVWLGPSPIITISAVGRPESVLATSTPPASKDQPFVNSLGMKFVPVPIPRQPQGSEPVEGRVLFSVWDTRVQDYEAFVKETRREWPKPDFEQGPTHPAVMVRWEDAHGFCQWLTEKEIAEGKLPKGLKYRLPSDEEWSWAVGLPPELGATPAEKNGKNHVDFPWGRDYPPRRKVGNYADEAFHEIFSPKNNANGMGNQWIEGYDDGYAATSPVGSFPANAHGLYDMGGNVWQWCEDWCEDWGGHRVIRGASWFNNNEGGSLLSSYRGHNAPGYRGGLSGCGFRCVLVVSAP